MTAPREPGNYDAGFTATAQGTCAGTASAEKVVTDALRVTTPGPNPNLPPRCGISVMLVLDESGSIASSGATEQVRAATRAFLNALSGTGAAVSIVDFSSTAARPVGYTTVTPESIASIFEPYLRDGFAPSGWTNWEAAFQKVREANTQGTHADLVVFITDGDPTARNTAQGGVVTGLTAGAVAALRPAAAQADLVKAQGSHVFALGVGAAVTGAASAARLTAVSGPDASPPADFGEADYTLVDDFDDLAAALRTIALELCQASVTVTKLVDEGDERFRPDPGWTFTADVAMSTGGYEWLQPAPPPNRGERSAQTDDAGVAKFQWSPTNAGATSTVTLGESVRPGYTLVDAACKTVSVSRTGAIRRVTRRVRTTSPRVTVTVGPGEYATCTVHNRILPGTIEIEKQAIPESSQPFAFTGSLGPFRLVDDGTNSSSRTFTGLAPGAYTVSELVPDAWSLTGIACTPAEAAAIAAPQVTITLPPGGAVVCTYQDTRTDPPAPPEPPHPPAPPALPDPSIPPEPPVGPASPTPTELRVVKTALRVARVGQRVPFRLSVTNVGPVAATNVRLADVPSAAVTLSGLRTTAQVRLVRGDAIWRLGTLPPGATRTVHGSVLVKAGSPGVTRNLVQATAANASLASDVADTRVAVPRRVPPVTG